MENVLYMISVILNYEGFFLFCFVFFFVQNEIYIGEYYIGAWMYILLVLKGIFCKCQLGQVD